MIRKIFLVLSIIFYLLNLDNNAQLFASEQDSNEVVTLSFEIKLAYGTQKVQIHGTREYLRFSQMVKKILKTSAISLFDYFEYVSEDTLHINLDEKATLANGSATVIPDTIINLNLMQALGTELLTADHNFIEGLVIHELTHILQLDQTRGFLGITSILFGSFGKWGFVTPRWFIEGIGVWAETKFTPGGRLRSKMMNAMLYKNILNPEFCQDVSCFDRPGSFPFGSHAYWMGGHFINYIEGLKKGNIKCLIESNSGKFPFFLDSSFRLCTGKMANEHYQDYRKILVQKASNQIKKLETNKILKHLTPLPLKYDSTILSKNFQILNNIFYRIEQRDDEEAIIATDLRTFKTSEYKSRNKIEQILTPTHFDRENSTLPLIGYPYLSMEVKRQTTGIDVKSQMETSKPYGESAQYSFSLGAKSTLFLKFDGLNWKLYKNDELYQQFSEFLSIYHPKLIGDHLYYTSYFEAENSEAVYRFEKLNIAKKMNKPESIYSNQSPFNYLANNDEKFVFTNDNEFLLINIKNLKLKRIPSEYIKDFAALRFSQKSGTVLLTYKPESFYSYNGPIENFLNKLKTKKKRIKKSTLKARSIRNRELSFSKIMNDDLTSYPQISHLRPHAWFFFLNSGLDSYNFIIAKTQLSDPRGHHTFGLTLKYYYDISKTGRDLSYQYMPNDFNFFLVHNKDYSATKYNIENIVEEVSQAGAGYKFDDQRLVFFPRVYFEKENTLDFLNYKKTTSYNLSLMAMVLRVNADDFLQSIQSDLIYSKKNPKKYSDFDKIDLLVNFKFRLNYSLGLNLKLSYAKLFKDDYKGGVSFAGGINERHSFLGLGSSDAYGNEISTAAGEFNLALFRPYIGSDFMPLYLRELHLILGEEILTADRIIYDSHTYNNNHILGTYIGLRTKLNIFYHAGVDLDFIFSKINAPSDAKDGYVFNFRILSAGF